MAPLISTLLSTVAGRGSPQREECIVCRTPVYADEPRMRLPGGGHVHSGCSTYSMRRQQRIRRRIGRR
ncbi:MAG: hypothetical protein QOK31_1293 [Solirubrobacteraceae bacterium]|jgi:hypothetical protein|nr:hypothetical protein [Solirubrobacteraceae bacterium]